MTGKRQARLSTKAVTASLSGADLYSMNPKHLKTHVFLWFIRKGDDIKASCKFVIFEVYGVKTHLFIGEHLLNLFKHTHTKHN